MAARKTCGYGQLVFNNLVMRLRSALDGLGLAYMPADQVLPEGRLLRVLDVSPAIISAAQAGALHRQPYRC
jgi:DNA-binding transcriptional LysR family regulator